MAKKLCVLVLMGGPSPEYEVSLKTGSVVLGALDRKKYNIAPVTITRDGRWLLPARTPLFIENASNRALMPVKNETAIRKLRNDKKIDVAFIAMHGAYGEDGTIQGFLELAGIPYTGSGVLASALAMDKIRAQAILAAHGITTPRFIHFSANEWKRRKTGILKTILNRFSMPVVIKPSNAGSSVGVSIVRDSKKLAPAIKNTFRFGDVAMVEEYIHGDEVTCGVIDDGPGSKPTVLPPTQIIPKTAKFFDYEAKYKLGASEEITPPRLPENIIRAIQQTAVAVHKIIGCSGMSRTDMIIRKNPKSEIRNPKIYVLETNTIPGMTETSLLPQEAKAAGIPFPQLLDRLIKAALRKKSGKQAIN